MMYTEDGEEEWQREDKRERMPVCVSMCLCASVCVSVCQCVSVCVSMCQCVSVCEALLSVNEHVTIHL